jgi:hypothetical protein
MELKMPKKTSATKPNIWVTRHPEGGWQTKRENSDRASKRHRTQKDAINSAIAQGKKDGVEVIIQGRDGKIRSKDSYGQDPIHPRDREH